MKTCLYCGKEYSDDETVSPIDQNALVDSGVIPGKKFNHQSSANESEALRGCAENLTIMAFICLLVSARGPLFSGCRHLYPGRARTGNWSACFWICGFAVSTAVLFFFFAQLIHIRALLAKK